MGFKRNKVKVDLCSYPPYIFLAERKFGKTTFWHELVKEAWGDEEKGLLISFGNEEGYHALDGIQVEVAQKWNAPYDEETDMRGFVQIVDDIIENNHEYGLKGVCFDTLDTMVDVCTEEVLKQHKKEKGTVCKTLNECFGGFSRGVERLVNLIREQENRLRMAGLAVFYLCHTKNKEKTDLKTGEKYEQITNNLQGNIYTKIADSAQMVMVGVMERDIVNGKIIDEERVIYLRGTSEVDAGSRFHTLPEKIHLSPREFLDAFEQGVKGSMSNDKADIEKMRKEEEAEVQKRAKIAKKQEEKAQEEAKAEANRDDIIADITDKLSGATADQKKQFKQMVVATGCTNIKSPDMPVDVLINIAEMLS